MLAPITTSSKMQISPLGIDPDSHTLIKALPDRTGEHGANWPPIGVARRIGGDIPKDASQAPGRWHAAVPIRTVALAN